ncbi:MAG: HAD hydrolase family protein [Thermoguttaceae bacterium]|nr:HAD hydrolase family protein [Thermoguttaceae bacterium]
MDLKSKLQKIRMILSDVDGCMTDGALIFDEQGNEIKAFHARDGLGISIWRRKGGLMGFVTRRCTSVVRKRAEELKIHELCQGVTNKLEMLDEICKKYELKPEQIAYVGDDLVDLAIMNAVGVSACPADSVPEILAAADYVCKTVGGRGVVREVIEQILKSRNEWKDFGF